MPDRLFGPDAVKTSHPLARVLLRKAMAWYLAFAVGITGIQLYFEYRYIRQNIVDSLNSLASTFAPGAASALWDYQQELLNSLAAGIGEHELVTMVEIADPHGRIGATHRAAETGTPPPDLTVRQTLYHRFEDGQLETLGTLRIASSEAKALAHLKGTALSVGLSTLAQLLFLGVMLAGLARILVVKPLTRFSEQVGRLAASNQQRQIDLGPVEIAEIATLQQGFNQLLREVSESHALITAVNADLERRVAERTRDLGQRNQELVREHDLTLALVRSIPGFVCVLDGAGVILLANHATGALIGSPGTPLIGRLWSSLPALASPDHPLRTLFHQAHRAGHATTQAGFPSAAGPEQTYQFEALRIGEGAGGRIVVVGVDITEQNAQKLRLEHLAFHDRLTGLPNRALLLDRLERILLIATRQHTRFAIAFVDLDRFKPINDSVGHEAGDAVLREIANRLCRCVRESDTVARYGGDEFVLLLPDQRHPEGWRRIADTVLNAVSQPIHWQDAVFQVGASIGFAVFPRDGGDTQLLLDAADAAMYRAKQAGRNRADFGAPPLEPQ
ncbi:MAG: diguanylate cyclase [Candidatus Competibacter sp.]|nr:diguanylate cyclase [Candidatus Competibacter sp.]MDG4582903.1 diguanylate cyclase [Candidatus Competibacter sp.]